MATILPPRTRAPSGGLGTGDEVRGGRPADRGTRARGRDSLGCSKSSEGSSMSDANLSPATFRVDDKELSFPRVAAVEGNDGVLIPNLLKETGLVTLDPGFMNTANCESQITFIDGDAGILRYRGYPIDQLAEKSSFLEVAYLLIYGELPSESDLDAF